MRAAWFVARAQLRALWGSVIVLTLIVGLTGAVVLASVAGARRTSTAFERFPQEIHRRPLHRAIPPAIEQVDNDRSCCSDRASECELPNGKRGEHGIGCVSLILLLRGTTHFTNPDRKGGECRSPLPYGRG